MSRALIGAVLLALLLTGRAAANYGHDHCRTDDDCDEGYTCELVREGCATDENLCIYEDDTGYHPPVAER